MNINDNEVSPHISAIHLKLVGARNMLVSDFKVASTGVGGGLGFSEGLESILKEIAEIEMQIAVLREMHPELSDSKNQPPKPERVEKAFNAVSQKNNSTKTEIEGKDTALYKDAKVISNFSLNLK